MIEPVGYSPWGQQESDMTAHTHRTTGATIMFSRTGVSIQYTLSIYFIFRKLTLFFLFFYREGETKAHSDVKSLVSSHTVATWFQQIKFSPASSLHLNALFAFF